MNKIEQTNKYYIYSYRRQSYLCVLYGLDELIDYIATYNYQSYFDNYGKIANRFLNNYNCTTKDISPHIDWECNTSYNLKEYIVFDEYFRIIDVRLYSQEILSQGICNQRFYQKRYNTEIFQPEFRSIPIPGTGKKRHGRYYRHMKTYQEIRKNSDPELKDYVRSKRKHLPTWWDEIPRHYSRSWKDCTKKKRQWM